MELPNIYNFALSIGTEVPTERQAVCMQVLMLNSVAPLQAMLQGSGT